MTTEDPGVKSNYFIAVGSNRAITSARARISRNPISRFISPLFPATPGLSLDFPLAMQQFINALCQALPEFAHINPRRILVGTTASRPGRHRSITWARIAAPRLDRSRQPVRPPIIYEQEEYDYIVTFCLPRYLNLTPEQKISTVIHELYHIHPSADGRLRIMGNRKHAHGSRRGYDEVIATITTKALEIIELTQYHQFLQSDLKELLRKYSQIIIRPLRLRQVK